MRYEGFVSIRWTKEKIDEPFYSFSASIDDAHLRGVYVMSHKDRIAEVKKLMIKLKLLT